MIAIETRDVFSVTKYSRLLHGGDPMILSRILTVVSLVAVAGIILWAIVVALNGLDTPGPIVILALLFVLGVLAWGVKVSDEAIW